MIRGFGPRQQLGHFGLQLRLDLARVLIRKRTVPAGIGVDLRAVERHRAQLEHPYLARQCQHLHEQPFDLLEKAPPKRRDRVVIGMVVCRDEAERHRIVRRMLQLPAGKHACGVAVNQNAQQQCWVIGRRSRAPIAPAHRRQVKPVNHLNDEPRQMSLRKPVIHRRRQKEASLAVNRAEIAQKRATQRGRKAESMQRFYPTPLSPTGC